MRSLIVIFMSAFLAGCVSGHLEMPVTTDAQAQLSSNVHVVQLDATNIQNHAAPARPHVHSTLPGGTGWDYRVGVGDVLSVIVFDHPELTLPAGPERSAAESGFRIQSDGTFFYPFVGQVKGAGLAPEQIRSELTRRLAEYIPNPQLEVRVAAYNSQSVVVTGEVRQPNRQPLTSTTLTLIEAVNSAGGLTEMADTWAVTVQRHGKTYGVDLAGFLSGGLVKNNPVLRNGDVVSVPKLEVQEAFVLGQVLKPSPIDVTKDVITVTQALSRTGGLAEQRADARGVFIFRLMTDYMTVYQLDMSKPDGLLLGTRFALRPQDVVYVTRSPMQKWNDTISDLLPTVAAVRGGAAIVGGY